MLRSLSRGAEFFLVCLLPGRIEAKVPSECQKWFEGSKAKPGTGRDCVMKCVSQPMGMETFYCGSYCDELCDREVIPKDDRYFRGTEYAACRDEFLTSARHPTAMQTVKNARGRAFALTTENFRQNRADDESDAFRHFLWSALITMNEGSEIAEKFLEAHESCVTEDAAQEMDRHNNRVGIEMAEKLRKSGKLSEDELVRQGKDLLMKRKLVVISPRRKIK